MVLDGLLFKIISPQGMELFPVLCIPTSKAHILLDYHHSSLFGGHSGISKCFQTISQSFYCPNLAENLWTYITRWHIHQLHKKGPSFNRPFQKRINLNVPTMTKISLDIKHMCPSRGYFFILIIWSEVTNFIVTLPLSSTKIPHIMDVFERGYLAYYIPPTHIICDMDPAFTSSLMEALSRQLNIKILTVSLTNCKSLLAEHGVKSLSSLLVKCLEQGWTWSSCLPYSMLHYNSYSSPNLDGFSPYELNVGHKMTINPDLEVQPDIVSVVLSEPSMRNSRKTYSIFAPGCKDLQVRELTF